jgi:hypothetical protein
MGKVTRLRMKRGVTAEISIHRPDVRSAMASLTAKNKHT